MKTFSTLLLIIGSLISVNVQAKLEIFTCEPEWAALAGELGGDLVNTFSATTGKQDPHRIEARPGLIAKIRRADLIICTGADLEAGWLPLLLSKSGNSKIQVGKSGYFLATDYVELLEKPIVLDRSQGDIHAAGNPHIHTSAPNIAQVAKALNQRLIELDGANADAYNRAWVDFNQRWSAAMIRWEQQAANIKHRTFVVDHKSWIYLANWLQLDMRIAIEPRPGIPPTTEYLASLIATIKQNNIQKIIYAAYSNPRAAQWLAGKTGATAVQLPYTVGGDANINNLFDLFDSTLQRLVN